MRVAAAEMPMNRANTGSATLDMRYAGAGIFVAEILAETRSSGTWFLGVKSWSSSEVEII